MMKDYWKLRKVVICQESYHGIYEKYGLNGGMIYVEFPHKTKDNIIIKSLKSSTITFYSFALDQPPKNGSKIIHIMDKILGILLEFIWRYSPKNWISLLFLNAIFMNY